MFQSKEPGFYFTKSERRGIVALIALILLLFIIKMSWNKMDKSYGELTIYQSENKTVTSQNGSASEGQTIKVHLQTFDPNTADEPLMAQLGLTDKSIKNILNYRNKGGRFEKPEDLQKIYSLTSEEYNQVKDYILIKRSTRKYESYKEKSYTGPAIDPNTVDSLQLLEIGLKSFVVKNILNYRRKGGRFNKVEDLKKIYGLDQQQYESIKPFIAIEPIEMDEHEIAEQHFEIPKQESFIRLDINSASQPEWEYLKGIGPGYAKRIVNFREKLGGFVHIDQVSETWGLPDSVFQNIKPMLSLDTPIRKIKINEADTETLSEHPYIQWKQAQLLVRYREHHGNYHSKSDILKIKVLEYDWVEKILPYIDFSPMEQ